MKLYLFGGAQIELNQVQPLKDLIKETILKLNPKQILLIPFARLNPIEEEWKEGWFKELMQDTNIEILDARNQDDLEKASDPLIFVNGGHGRLELIKSIKNNSKILSLIVNTKYYVSESSGSMVTAQYMREGKEGGKIINGLGILKDTIIEPHFSERNYQPLLQSEMQRTGAKYGIGIDCVTAIIVDTTNFPQNWTKIGSGKVNIELLVE